MKLAPTLWDNVTLAVEQASQYYAALQEFPVEFSGRVNHTIWVAVFRSRAHFVERKPERERIMITFHGESNTVEVRSSLEDASAIFHMDLNGAGRICLRRDDHEVSVEAFTDLALHRAFFPSEP